MTGTRGPPPRLVFALVCFVSIAALASAAHAAPCPSGARCGTVPVLLDRAHPDAGQLQIAYQLIPRTQTSTPAAGTIVPLTGGPGGANSAVLDAWLQVFGPLLSRFDLLVVDARGTGGSASINCADLQHKGITRATVEACASQLGPARDFYRSSSVADDLDDVRAALGIDKIDLYGFSWGTVQARSYATRHGDHLRSLIMDSAGQQMDIVPLRSKVAANSRRELELVCKRSRMCSATGDDPVKRTAALAAALRRHPVRGTTYGPGGRRQKVRVTEQDLFSSFFSEVFAQVPAVARAFAHGDSAPLLRFIAENDFDPGAADAGPPAEFSVGHTIANLCNDLVFPWSWASPVADRQRDWLAAFAALPQTTFSPFSLAAGRDNPQGIEALCMFWPAPASSEPPVAPGASFSPAPALFVSGDMDGAPVDVARDLASQFPNSTFVEPRNVFHGAAFSGPCVSSIIDRFVDQLSAGETNCASKGMPIFGYSLFPRTAAADKLPVKRLRGDHSTARDRHAVAAALDTIVDAAIHGITGHGLRGGSVMGNPPVRMTLRAARFVRDVAVSGNVALNPATLAAIAAVKLSGAGTDPGRLEMSSRPGGKPVEVKGSLGGRRIHERVNLPN